MSRYAGATLQNVADERFESIRIPAGPGHYGTGSQLVFDKSTTVEGHISSYFYVAPVGRTALEVFRNYQGAFKEAGLATLFSCELRACDTALIKEPFGVELVRARKWANGRGGDPAGSIDRDVRFISAKGTRAGADTWLMLFVAEPNSIWGAPAVVLVVAEPVPMQAGQVVVNTERLQKALEEEGRIALYGIYFDSGRSEVKPESKAQLDEMARLLSADKSRSVVIVGHTDNQGSIDTNQTLSQRRAEAVVAALVGTYKIDAQRLRARGVASLAPVASNRNEAGRAKNRRVEMVEP